MFKDRINIRYLKGCWVMVLKEKGNIIEDIDDILGYTFRWFWCRTETDVPGKRGGFCVVFFWG